MGMKKSRKKTEAVAVDSAPAGNGNGGGPRAGGPLAESLKGRSWPRNPEQQVTGEYDQAPWVKTGRVFTRALRMHQQLSEPIPDGESAITSLCVGKNGMIYGATSGRRSHLFYYDPSPTGDGVVDIAVVPGVTDVRRGLVSIGAKIYLAATATTDPEGGAIFVHDTAPDYQDEFRAYRDEMQAERSNLKRLVVPVEGEGIAALCADPERAILYGLSSVTGTFFEYDLGRGEVELFGRVSRDGAFSRMLVADGAGCIYGTSSLGTLFRYSPAIRHVEDLEIRIPTVAGREFYNALDSAVFEPVSGLIYGAGTADGVIFILDPRTLETRALGKVIAEPRVRAMTAALDGTVYGIAGCEEGMGHLFRYDPKKGELRDFGILMAASEVWRRGFEFDAACTGLDGTLYFGESERDSHLFLYFPPQTAASARRVQDYEDLPF